MLTPEGLHMTEMLKNIIDEEMSLLEEVWPKHLAEAAIETLDAWNDTQP